MTTANFGYPRFHLLIGCFFGVLFSVPVWVAVWWIWRAT